MRIALVNMPAAVATSPSPALGILKSHLTQEQIDCSDIYANVLYAHYIGFDEYQRIFDEHDLLAGNFLFAHLANNKQINAHAYFEAAAQRRGVQSDSIEQLTNALHLLVEKSRLFLENLEDYIEWGQFDFFAFSSTYQQQAATIAFSKILKKKYPNIPIICGGANFHAEMGSAWLRAVPSFDYVCNGEGEDTLVALLRCLSDGISLNNVPNLCFRSGNEVLATSSQRYAFNSTLLPDYDSYYSISREVGLTAHPIWAYHRLPIETSRGCWWGQKHHCIFCGLNGPAMSSIELDGSRAYELVTASADKYNTRDIFFVDNIMPRSYPKSLFPALSKQGYDLNIFFETKSNLTIDELRIMSDGGVKHLQPGIESLSTQILKIMKKGVSAYQNIYLLKWCQYFGIKLSWNLLWGLPNENEEYYQNQIDLFKKIVHLEPPGSIPQTVVQRFSPMFKTPEMFSIKDIKPAKVFTLLFPDYKDEHKNISYFFDNEGAIGINMELATIVRCAVDDWKQLYHSGAALFYSRLPGMKLLIIDQRIPTVIDRKVYLYPASFIYEACSYKWHTVESIMSTIEQINNSDVQIDQESIRSILSGFVDRALMILDGKHYLSLAVPTSQELKRDPFDICENRFFTSYTQSSC